MDSFCLYTIKEKIAIIKKILYNKNSKTTVVTENEQLKAYQKAKQYAETHGIKIYNATRGGKLEVFERVDFDSLFEKENRIKK